MYADRIKNLPPYLFAGIDKAKQEARARGVDVIDLSVGDPDLPTPDHIVQALKQAANDSSNHQYPSYEGKLAFRNAVADWYKKTFDIDLDPKNEVLTLIGSKEGIAHAPLAFINPGDVALVPDPAYPVYATATAFAGGEPAIMPLLRENGFLPDLDAIPADVARRAKIMFLNYPNNPIGATASEKFFGELVDYARDHNIIIMHDNPYSEIYYDGNRSLSILEIDGAKDVAVEFHSLSKTYNMTGWRIGSVVGNADVVAGIGKVKSNIDSGTFGAVQDAGIVALSSPKEVVDEIRKVYQQRIEILYKALKDIGLELEKPRATLYLWAWVKGSSIDYAAKLLERTGIVATPGLGFGKYGEGYMRFSITRETKRVEEAARRLEKMKD
ncbi:LL-diaminopimelate aminotransferase [Methanothrix soehngenii]|jgi:LL-diaminopimelate aminotransferase|uniref:LL-diaminopimelate aminotransferase n=1 Tax=Methanothrix soehngenii TaxID=2223 RepID=UPI0023F35E38|nr:LL-diaminopimelate aminotransferase [Methanothrix soehngenii]MCK9585647.1 LL-diaminopimelate aminotransferase [Methanothrix soehngenii]MDD5256649.1 LL-diaminopimelate aminotransferase [Methanothrix soehngenii]MDD5734013.1 LL-diaminopimelate aminotransferase [Methanothrix soehngenii]